MENNNNNLKNENDLMNNVKYHVEHYICDDSIFNEILQINDQELIIDLVKLAIENMSSYYTNYLFEQINDENEKIALVNFAFEKNYFKEKMPLFIGRIKDKEKKDQFWLEYYSRYHARNFSEIIRERMNTKKMNVGEKDSSSFYQATVDLARVFFMYKKGTCKIPEEYFVNPLNDKKYTDESTYENISSEYNFIIQKIQEYNEIEKPLNKDDYEIYIALDKIDDQEKIIDLTGFLILKQYKEFAFYLFKRIENDNERRNLIELAFRENYNYSDLRTLINNLNHSEENQKYHNELQTSYLEMRFKKIIRNIPGYNLNLDAHDEMKECSRALTLYLYELEKNSWKSETEENLTENKNNLNMTKKYQ